MFTVMWVRIESFLVFHSLVISAFPLEIELLGGLWILLIYLTSARSCICFKPAFPMPYVKVYFVSNELRWELTFRCVVIGGFTHHHCLKGPGGSICYVVGLPHNSYKPITNTTWVLARLCKLQKGCTQPCAVACSWSVVLSGYSGFFHHWSWSPWYSWNIA